MFQLHNVQMPDTAGPVVPDRLTLASVLNVAFPAIANAVAALGAVTAGTGYTAIPNVVPTGGTLAAGGWQAVVRLTLKVITPTLVLPGSGYVVNEVLTFANGVQITVNTVTSGAIATFTLTNAGSFNGGGVLPGSGGVPVGPQSQVSTSGVGSGATFTFVWGLNTATLDDSGNYSVLPTGYTISPIDGNGTGGALATGAAGGAGSPVFRNVGPFLNDGLPPNYGVLPVVVGSQNVAVVNEKCTGYASIRIYGIEEGAAAASVTAGAFDAFIWA